MEFSTMTEAKSRPENDLPRRERTPVEELRDWETLQDNGPQDQTQRLTIVGGRLYRTTYNGAVALVFVPGVE
jgi:hypothetical protein